MGVIDTVMAASSPTAGVGTNTFRGTACTVRRQAFNRARVMVMVMMLILILINVHYSMAQYPFDVWVVLQEFHNVMARGIMLMVRSDVAQPSCQEIRLRTEPRMRRMMRVNPVWRMLRRNPVWRMLRGNPVWRMLRRLMLRVRSGRVVIMNSRHVT